MRGTPDPADARGPQPGRRVRRRAWPGWIVAICLLAGAAQPARPAGAAELAISCGALGVELALCRRAVADWEDRTGHRVTIVSTPNSSTERLALYQQVLAAKADDIDVLQIDVVWPGILANHLADLAPHVGDAADGHFPAIIANNTVEGRLLALPWWTDAGVLYYRRDLLERHGRRPPETWTELAETAALIQAAERQAGNRRMWGYVWQGRAYEGLTCNVLEWIASFGGGTIVGDDGRITIDNEQAASAFAEAARWVGTITPAGVLNYDEEAARGVFQTGNAVFMRNWPYAWALAQGKDSPIRGRVEVAPLPKGGPDGRTAATLGGWSLAVSRYSRQPALAADLVLFLTRADEQRRRAIEASYNPTRPDLYRDQAVLAANPFFGRLLTVFENAVARPSRIAGRHYNRVSSALWRATHDILARGADPAERLERLAARLRRVAERAGW